MPRQAKRNYPSTKVPTVKLCADCKSPITRKADLCTACEMYRKRTQNRRSELDEQYRIMYRKHKQL